MNTPARALRLAGISLVFALACGDDSTPRTDTGLIDGGRRDVSTADVPTADVPGTDGMMPDVDLDECTVTDVTIAMDFIGTPRPVSVQLDPMGYLVAWRQQMGAAEDVYTGVIGMDGTSVLSTNQLTDDLGSKRNLVMRDGIALWEDDLAERIEFQIRGVPAGGGTEFDVTSDTGNAQRPSVAALGAEWVIGYSEQNGGTWDVKVRTWDGSALGNATTIATVPAPVDLALHASGDQMMAAWAQDGDIMMQALNASAVDVGEPFVVSTEGNAVGPVKIAFGELGGVVVFDVSLGGRPEIRSRLLNNDGTPKRAEQIVSLAPSQGQVANVIYYMGGFAAIYHDRLMGESTVKLVFIHGSDGDIVDEIDLGTAAFDDGLPGVAVRDDGLIAAAWAETSGAGTDIRGRRVRCPGAWLRCSPMGTE